MEGGIFSYLQHVSIFILASLRKEEVGALLPLAVTVIPGTGAQVSLPGPITGQLLSVGISLLGWGWGEIFQVTKALNL